MTDVILGETIEILLSARRYLYAVLQSLFGNEPSDERLRAVSLPLLREASALLGVDAAAADLTEALEAASGDVDDVERQYTYLFVGPHELPAPPWESVYATKERVLFHPRTLKVRNFYRSEGLIPQHYPSVADDHIALELDFLRSLADRAVEAQASGDRATCVKALDVSRRFIEFHVGTWVGSFSEDLDESGCGMLYPAAGRLLVALVRVDGELLDELTKS